MAASPTSFYRAFEPPTNSCLDGWILPPRFDLEGSGRRKMSGEGDVGGSRGRSGSSLELEASASDGLPEDLLQEGSRSNKPGRVSVWTASQAAASSSTGGAPSTDRQRSRPTFSGCREFVERRIEDHECGEATEGGMEGDSEVSSSRGHDPVWELAGLTCFNFPYGLICGTMGLYVLPAEALRLYADYESIVLGISLGIVGVTQLVCPIAGKVSDRYPAESLVGRRQPFILGGTGIGVVAVLGMWVSSKTFAGFLYYICLFVGMVCLNILYSVSCGLVPDVVEEASQGRASGIVAVHTVAGSGAGFGLVIWTHRYDYHFVYGLYILLMSLACGLSLLVAHRMDARNRVAAPHSPRASSIHDGSDGVAYTSIYISLLEQQPDTASTSPGSGAEEDGETVTSAHSCSASSGASISRSQDGEREQTKRLLESQRVNEEKSEGTEATVGRCNAFGLTWREIFESYTIDTSEGYDFFCVFLGRTFYYLAVSCQAFMLYYLRDVVGTTIATDRSFQIGCIALLAQGTAAALAYPIGYLSDSIGKKPLIYAACMAMNLTYIGFLVAPYFHQWAFLFVLSTAFVYGVGNGCFLAVDYALALATLPSRENSAQALGIWGVSAFIGSAIGPLLWGFLIAFLGRGPDTPEGQYAYTGYAAMLVGGMMSTTLAGAVIRLVKKVE